MCGIFCCVQRNNQQIQLTKFKSALSSITHRGPDSHGYWFSNDQSVGLGHTRLSIIDLDHGEQPISSSDGKIQIVVNGEFYDYKKIRRDYQKKGYHFKTSSDSEILIPLYLEHGEKFFEHLRGEFAFVLWDDREKKLLFARDRMGIKPLYYHLSDGNLFIASEIKALLKFGIPAIWDENTLYLSNHSIYQQERTYFKDIYALRPGHYAIFKDHILHKKEYWDFNFSSSRRYTNGYSEQELIAEFKSAFYNAVQVRLEADVEVGCYLSGGLDSSAVLGVASRLSNKKVRAFSIGYDDDVFNESHISTRTCKHLDVEHSIVLIKDEDIRDNFVKSLIHSESPVMNTHGVSLFLLSKHVREHGVKCVLTGGGADETLAGYSFFKEDYLNHHSNKLTDDQARLLNDMRSSKIGAGLVCSSQDISFSHEIEILLNYIPELFRIYKSRGKLFKNLYHESYLKRMSSSDAISTFINSFDSEKFNVEDKLNISAYLFSKSTLPGYILSTVGDRMEMAHSIEGRVPFLDNKLVEFTSSLPVEMKIHNMIEKYILREATLEDVTPEIYKRMKQPFFGPPSYHALKEIMQDVFNSDSFKQSSIYDAKKVLSLLNKMPELDEKTVIENDSLLMEILSFHILQTEFRVSYG